MQNPLEPGSPAKIRIANDGVRELFRELRPVNGVKVNREVWTFSNSQTLERFFRHKGYSAAFPPAIRANGGTALIESLSVLCDKLLSKTFSGQLDIYTDGQENASNRKYTKSDLAKKIRQLEARGWKVSFYGSTQQDINEAKGFGIQRSAMVADSRSLNESYTATMDSFQQSLED